MSILTEINNLKVGFLFHFFNITFLTMGTISFKFDTFITYEKMYHWTKFPSCKGPKEHLVGTELFFIFNFIKDMRIYYERVC